TALGCAAAPRKAGALRTPTRGKPARHKSSLTTEAYPPQRDWYFGVSGTSIALSIHLPGYRSIGYPPTQSRPHKKVRTRPIGTHRHGLIKNAFFETAVPPVPLGTDKVLEWLDLSLMK
ncbi:hypothetical protein, partial [Pseudomonas sp. DWP1b1]|uniref:hypothetical protein n=1 Tax=Pseudomonas sp. DWP1b1 TaxID=2804658 RepID=UPI003CF8A182